MTVKLQRLIDENPFLDGPAEFLCKTVAKKMREVTQFTRIFGDFIDPYKRMDYPQSALPALRIYNNSYEKQFDSWFVEGEMVLDCIWPASIRRTELQQFPDTIASAILQQFRRTTFFSEIETEEEESDAERNGFKLIGVPGLNELGKRFSVDKSLAFQLGPDEVVPLTQMTVNFRIDLRQWDSYLEENCRTKDKPFEQTLGELERIVSTIEGLRDDETVEVEVSLDQNIGD